MSKTKVGKRKVRTKVTIRTKVAKPRYMGGMSEANAAAKRYADMLLDPCRAALDYAPYDSTRLDFVQRRKAVGVSGTEPYVYTLWHPSLGAYSYAGANGSATGFPTANAPLSPFLTSNVPAAKAVAGCFSVEWIGAESARQGWISAGVVPGSLLAQCIAYQSSPVANSIDSWARICTHTERMPIDKFEINWVPGPKDVVASTWPGDQFAATSEAFWKQELEGRNFILVVLSNVGSSSVLNTVTAVCEVSQNANTNTTVNAASVSKPMFDYTAVIQKLQNKDTSWYINTFKKVANFAAGALGAYTGGGLPGVLGYLAMGGDQTVRASTKNFKS